MKKIGNVVALGDRLKPMSLRGLSLDARRAALMMECGYSELTLDDGRKIDLAAFVEAVCSR